MLVMLKVVQGQQLKKSIKRDLSSQPILISFWMSPYDGGGIDGSCDFNWNRRTML